ncbi:MAG: hypothetical protein FKY71_07575 [Spiribacter salinus]|uniref:asparagine synthase (glutamine-hydrolyzing) n=1 Tax=Spiribacter salinus TaxID=1335746 RepID=A0A540VSA4_9GAMM|nr:MAG: hypothetical protein FKY71_07575 [Spiribacter salinus]
MNAESAYLRVFIDADGSVNAEGDWRANGGYRLEEKGAPVAGAYFRWAYDGGDILVENDPYGLYPVFYSTFGDSLRLATRIGLLLDSGVPRDLDHDALAAFLRLRFQVGDRTPFSHIRRLPPAAKIIRAEKGFRVEGSMPGLPRPYSGSKDAAVDDYISLFRQSMRRLLDADPEFVLPLSGGRDSRHILLEAMRQGHKPVRAFTAGFPPPRNENDRAIAAKLLEGTGVPHCTVDPQFDLFASGELHDRLTEGLTAEHVWAMPLRRRLESTGLAIFDGLGGDTLSAGLFQDEERQRVLRESELLDSAETLLEMFQQKAIITEGVLEAVLRPSFLEAVDRSRALDCIASELERHRSHHNPLQRFNVFNRTRNGPGMFSFGVLPRERVRVPYFDYDLFQFLDSLPGEFVSSRDFHTLAIEKAFPEFATVPYAEPGPPRRIASHQSLLYFLRLSGALSRSPASIPVRRGEALRRTFGAMLRRDAPLDTWWHPRLLQFLLTLGRMAEPVRRERNL